MAFPAQSNFWSSAAGSAWWQHRDGAQLYLCATQGRTLIRQLQRELKSRLPLVYAYNGVAGTTLDIDVTGTFDATTFSALMRACEDLDIPIATRSAIESDYAQDVTGGGDAVAGARGIPLSRATTMVATWIAFDNGLPFASIVFPTDLATIRFNLAAPDDGDAVDTWACVPSTSVVTNPSTPEQPDIGIIGNVPAETPAASSSGLGIGLLVLGGLAAYAWHESTRRRKG